MLLTPHAADSADEVMLDHLGGLVVLAPPPLQACENPDCRRHDALVPYERGSSFTVYCDVRGVLRGQSYGVRCTACGALHSTSGVELNGVDLLRPGAAFSSSSAYFESTQQTAFR